MGENDEPPPWQEPEDDGAELRREFQQFAKALQTLTLQLLGTPTNQLYRGARPKLMEIIKEYTSSPWFTDPQDGAGKFLFTTFYLNNPQYLTQERKMELGLPPSEPGISLENKLTGANKQRLYHYLEDTMQCEVQFLIELYMIMQQKDAAIGEHLADRGNKNVARNELFEKYLFLSGDREFSQQSVESLERYFRDAINKKFQMGYAAQQAGSVQSR